MDEILKSLTDNQTFYLATVEGDKPKVRPFGFVMEFEGKLYFRYKQSERCLPTVKGKPLS